MMNDTLIDRRTFLRASAAGVLASAGMSSFAFADAAGAKILLSAPLTHSDWVLKPNISWGMPGVRHMLDACKACGWSHVYWRVCDAGRSTYASKLLDPGDIPDADNFFNPQNDADRALMLKYTPTMTDQRRAEILKAFDAMDYGTFDSLAAALEYGHSIGLKIHAWVSINEDDHGWGWPSRFAKQNPQFRWVRRNGQPYRSQMSFAFPQVREYKLGIIDELLAYPIDGLFMDWIRTGDVRDNPQTDPKGVADSGYEEPNLRAFRDKHGKDAKTIDNGDETWCRVRAEPQTLFMRGLHERAKAKNVPVCAMVGHPWHYRGHVDRIDGNLRGLLLDVNTWAKEALVDAVIPAGYYRDGGTPEMAYDALKKETDGKVDVWFYGWVPQNVAEVDRDVALAQKLGAPRVLFWEADYIDDRPNAAELKAAMSAKAKWEK
jgi:hypothetical protein